MASAKLHFATLGPVGYASFAPGTLATAIPGIPAAWMLAQTPLWFYLAAIVLIAVAGSVAASEAERHFGREDPGEVVVDELAGFLVTMIGLPHTPVALLLGFLAFRLFDIWKPWPVHDLEERIPGGAGIVVDDLAAGVYAHILVWVILHLL